MNIAFFAAHPDDHEMMLAYGILDAIATHSPTHVFAYVATDGKASTLGDPAFVQSGSRRTESQAGLTSLNLNPSHLRYPDLPDGRLADPATLKQLTADITAFITRHHITRAVTLGPDGGDGHPDHIAVHQAVMAATAQTSLEVWSLSATHTGPHIIPSTPGTHTAKLHALACHPSQFPDLTNIPVLYHPYLKAETYDIPKL